MAVADQSALSFAGLLRQLRIEARLTQEELLAVFASGCSRHAAGPRILATSREFLDVRGEHAIQTPPLAVPDDPALAPLSDAVQLFLARAAAGAPWFRPDEADLRTVMQVCRRLDGLPLAIELAAARLRALSLSQLAARLDDQFWLEPRPGPPAAHPGGHRRMELRPAKRGRAARIRAPGRVPGPLHLGHGRGRGVRAPGQRTRCRRHCCPPG